jgi:peptidyl-prolyl cis-trans isomerase-like 4
VVEMINKAYVDSRDFRPLQNIRIKHTVVIDDPFDGKDAEFNLSIKLPSRSPSPIKEPQDVDLKRIEFADTVFLDDDIKLETKKKTEAQLKQEKIEADT